MPPGMHRWSLECGYSRCSQRLTATTMASPTKWKRHWDTIRTIPIQTAMGFWTARRMETGMDSRCADKRLLRFDDFSASAEVAGHCVPTCPKLQSGTALVRPGRLKRDAPRFLLVRRGRVDLIGDALARKQECLHAEDCQSAKGELNARKDVSRPVRQDECVHGRFELSNALPVLSFARLSRARGSIPVLGKPQVGFSGNHSATARLLSDPGSDCGLSLLGRVGNVGACRSQCPQN